MLGQALDRGDPVLGLEVADPTEHGLKALPLMCEVHALHTLMPQPYLGPVTPRRSRSTHRTRTSSLTFDGDGLAVEDEGLLGHVCVSFVSQRVSLRPLVGDGGTGGTNDLGLNEISPWLIGNDVGIFAGRPGVGARHGGRRRADRRLAGTAGGVGVGRHDVDLDVRRHVPLARVEVVVPAGLEELAVAQVAAAGQRQRDAVHGAALHLGLEPARVDRPGRRRRR